MASPNRLIGKIAFIAALVDRAPVGFGRTALMKCLFFLQVLRRVPLGYDFRLYTYGPFDSDVLDDLSWAERLGTVSSELQGFSGGHRYELRRGDSASKVIESAREFVQQYENDIDWVMKVFGRRRAVDLEMASTIIFTDRSVAEKNQTISIRDLVRRVHDIKPHLSEHVIEREAVELQDNGLLIASS